MCVVSPQIPKSRATQSHQLIVKQMPYINGEWSHRHMNIVLHMITNMIITPWECNERNWTAKARQRPPLECHSWCTNNLITTTAAWAAKARQDKLWNATCGAPTIRSKSNNFSHNNMFVPNEKSDPPFLFIMAWAPINQLQLHRKMSSTGSLSTTKQVAPTLSPQQNKHQSYSVSQKEMKYSSCNFCEVIWLIVSAIYGCCIVPCSYIQSWHDWSPHLNWFIN